FSQVTDEDSYTGWLKPSAKVDVRARVRGHIQKVYFHDGDMVKKDELLFELDPRPFQAQIDQALAKAKAIEAEKTALEKDVARYQLLIKSRAVSQQDLDKAIADVGYATAQIDAAMEEVRTKRLDLEFSRITAPIAGQIGRALLTEGNLVNAGGSDPILTTIVAMNPISLYFSVDEPALQKFIKTQQAGKEKDDGRDKTPLRERKLQIRFGLDTDEGYPHTAILDFANNEIDSETGTIEVRAEVENPKGKFAPGYRVRVRVPVGAPYDAILVPETAINTDQDRKFLLIVDAKGNVKSCDLRDLGRLLDNGKQVVKSSEPPLTKETQIIVEGMQRARLNYPVEPIHESTATEIASK
ncbi:MAG TPA: efflux RND transporter periplasmic adaptor subunit, partial [Pirellulales bacterium]